jgi:hypothetical protein
VQPYAAARRPNTRPRDRCIRAARVALICVGQRRQRVSRSRKIEPRETPSSGIRPNAKQLVSSLWPMHETRQPAFQWWRGLRRFVRRPDLDERERAGRGAVHMQPPRRCTTQCRRSAVGVPRNALPPLERAHLWSPPGVTPIATSASHPFWEPFSHFVLFVGPFVHHGEIAVGCDHPLAGQIESWWAT